jgi:hypothetical protein
VLGCSRMRDQREVTCNGKGGAVVAALRIDTRFVSSVKVLLPLLLLSIALSTVFSHVDCLFPIVSLRSCRATRTKICCRPRYTKPVNDSFSTDSRRHGDILGRSLQCFQACYHLRLGVLAVSVSRHMASIHANHASACHCHCHICPSIVSTH